MCLSLGLSSFASNVTHLILSQGIGFGFGGCLAYTPSILFMSEWFVKRKGFAFGIVWVSACFPPSQSHLTDGAHRLDPGSLA